MDWTTALGALGSAASGGLLGLFGTGFKLWADHKAQQAKRSFEIQMRKLDQAEMQLEHQLRMREVEAQARKEIAVATVRKEETEAQASAEVEKAEIQLRQASYQQDKATYGGGFVDAVRGLMRPILTLYFAVLMALIAYQLFQLANVHIGTATASYLLKDIINACIFLATTSVTWWFGSRPIHKGRK